MFMAWALELRETRNRWAHNEPLNGGDAYRAFDSVERLPLAVGAGEASPATEPPKPRPPALPPGVELFWRDDVAYLFWRDSHPSGYVVNCDHEPKASYVKLHRTICPFMNLQNVRSWTYPYMKVCSAETRLLDQWVAT